MARRAPRRYHAAMQTPAHRWTTSWQTLGLTPPDGLLEALRARYAEPHRHYHATEHLDACLRQFLLRAANPVLTAWDDTDDVQHAV